MSNLTSHQKTMRDVWQQHGQAEFILKDPDAAIATMSDDPYILAIPFGQLLSGREAVYTFYRDDFLCKIPPDLEMEPVRQVVGDDHIADEFVLRFTHSVEMPWQVPGVAPTGRRAEIVMMVLVGFEGDKMAYEHLMWNHAALLSQLGVVDSPLAATGNGGAGQLLGLSGTRA